MLLTAVLALTAAPAQAEDYYPDVTATISYSSDSVRVGDEVTMTVSVDKSAGPATPTTEIYLEISTPSYLTWQSVTSMSLCGRYLMGSRSSTYIRVEAFEAEGPTSCVFVAKFLAARAGTSAAPTTSGNIQVVAKPAAGITSLATPVPASLSALLTKSGAVKAADYTSTSYAAFKSVYNATTSAIASDPGMDDAVMAALEPPLQTALDSMVSVTSLVVPEQNLIAAMSVYPYPFTGADYAELNRVLREIMTARVAGTETEIAALVIEAQTVIDAQVSRADLIDASVWINEYVEEDYTAWSWAIIQDMKRLANYGNLDDPLTYTDEDIAWALDWILNSEQVVINIKPLVTAIDSADSISTEGMAPVSVARFDAAVAAMVQWREDATDPDNWIWDFQPMIDEFDAAVYGLHSLGPIHEAQAMLDTLVEGDYTSASWNNIVLMRAALADIVESSADGVLLPNEYIIEQADEAQEMVDSLVSIRPLLDAIASVDSVNTTNMSAFSVYWLDKRVQELIELRDTENWITDEDIAEAVAVFSDQVDNRMVSLTPLIDAAAAGEAAMAGLAADGYTGSSWTGARAAIAQVKSDLELWSTDRHVPVWQSLIDFDIANMNAAINSLVRASLIVKLGDERVMIGSTIPAGSQLHFEAEGLQPGTQFWVELHSTPTTLGSVLADADGKASLWVTVPKDFAAGSHTLHVFSTELGAFAPTDAAFPITVTSGQSVAAPAGNLASTGGAADGFALGAGFLLLLVGAGLRLSVRRTRAHA
ncbi:hypothetical protein ACX3O0_04525 [Homoserinimonas sp. A447]